MDQELVIKLTKDLKAMVASMGQNEARALVDRFVQSQRSRLRADGQIRAAKAEGEKQHEVLQWASDRDGEVERQLMGALKCYAESQPMGQWAMRVTGIGPVIAAGLLAHVDIAHCPTVGHLWAFAGFDPTREWKKGEKRPHNASLKTLCWKAGECFVKVKNKPESLYGKLYDQRKEYEQAKNEAGDYKAQAEAVLARTPKHAQAKTYKTGKLPDGHLHSRAKRWAVKIFLSHWWEQAYWFKHGCAPPKPFAIEHAGHAHYIEPEVPILKEKV